MNTYPSLFAFISLVVSHYGGAFFSIGCSIFLSRFLKPTDLGLVVVPVFFFDVCNFLTEWGWEQGFFANKTHDFYQLASTHYALRILTGLFPFFVYSIMCLIGFIPIILLCRPVVFSLCCIYFIERIGFTHKTILEKKMELSSIAFVELSSIIFSGLVAVTFGFFGYGFWSLLAQRFTEKLCMTLGYWYCSSHVIRPKLNFEILFSLWYSFGISMWVGGIFGLYIYDFMNTLVGVYSGVYEAGLYARAFKLATFPLMLTGIFQRMTSPLYVCYQKNGHVLKRIFIRAQSIKFLILAPLQFFLACTASWWIPHFFGIQWNSMVQVYQMLSVYGFLRAFYDDVPNIFLYGLRYSWVLPMLNGIQAIFIWLVAPLLLNKYAAFGGALSMSLMMGIAALLLWVMVIIFFKITWADFSAIIQVDLRILQRKVKKALWPLV